MAMKRATRWTWTGLLGTIAAAVGCGKPNGTAPGPGAGTPPPVVKQARRSVWEPDPNRADQLTQPVSAGKYRLSLPKGFTAVEPKANPAGTMTTYVWHGPTDPDVPPPTLAVAVTSDPKMVGEANKNMRQALVNFSAGVANTSGIRIAQRGATETGSLDGIAFSRFKWTGSTKDRVPVSGLAYGGDDDASVVAILAMDFGPDADAANKLMEAIIATFKKQ